MRVIKNKTQIILTVVLLGFVGWWISFQHVLSLQGKSVQVFESGVYGGVALIGAIIGTIAAFKWGGIKSTLGKALLFFSFGLLLQEAGQLIYTWYVYVDKIQIPYPSLGDVAYFGSVLSYIYAVILLAKAAGVKTSLRLTKYKFVAVIIPLILLVVSSYILLHNHKFDTTKPLTVFLDAGYPIGEALYISIAIVAFLLSRKLLGGILKSGILLIIFALLVQYVADFTFVFQSNRNTYIPGNYDDLLYLIAYYVMALSLLNFYVIYKKIKTRNATRTENG